MKRSLSVPIIPVLEAIHFDHIHTYTPENESLMEREVKIVRQREAALRMARGLAPLVSEAMHEIEVSTPRPRIEDHHHPEQLSKKYAENRLRTELHKEKQREIDLLKLGKIQSLSEHRKGEFVKYADVVSSETEELREFARSRSTLQRDVSTDRSSMLSPASYASLDFEHGSGFGKPHARRTSFDGEIKGHRGNYEVEIRGPRGHIEIESKGHHGAVSHVRKPVHHTLVRTSSEEHSTRPSTEKRIELEVAEAKRRENELR